jgi:lipopolysaccharide transport system ATP-binding protein
MGAIKVSSVGKAYKQYFGRWSRLLEWTLPFTKKRHTLKWVLEDISFNIGGGEAVGVIGVNGAGKSTLLKIITGTSAPTTGSVTITGRVAALLELGMGFHPDFTGRQNLYMSGQLIGLSNEQVSSLMPHIEAFAEIGDYIDMPVRVYSSGMQVRLAFSIATAVRPDILIIDEALSVGDAYFQHKSFDRIKQYREQGTTILLVSHDKQAIQSICDRAILLNGGFVAKEGAPEEVMDFYNALIADRENNNIKQELTEDGKITTTSGTGEATVSSIEILDTGGSRVETISVGQSITLKAIVKVKSKIPKLVLGFMIKDRVGQVIFGTNTHIKELVMDSLDSGSELSYSFDFTANLGVGTYSVATALVSNDTHLENNYEWRDLALVFSVINTNKEHFIGSSWIDCSCKVEKL